MQTHLITIQKSLPPVADSAIALAIVDDSSMKEAVDLLSQLNQYNDHITEEKEKVTRPLNEALKAERARWKPVETLYEEAIASLRAKMASYQTAQVKARKEAEEAIVTRIAPGKGHIKLETAVLKIENLFVVQKEVATEKGLVQFREKVRIKIIDDTLIPREYLMVDESKVLADLKNNKNIPGVELETVQVPVNYR